MWKNAPEEARLTFPAPVVAGDLVPPDTPGGVIWYVDRWPVKWTTASLARVALVITPRETWADRIRGRWAVAVHVRNLTPWAPDDLTTRPEFGARGVLMRYHEPRTDKTRAELQSGALPVVAAHHLMDWGLPRAYPYTKPAQLSRIPQAALDRTIAWRAARDAWAACARRQTPAAIQADVERWWAEHHAHRTWQTRVRAQLSGVNVTHVMYSFAARPGVSGSLAPGDDAATAALLFGLPGGEPVVAPAGWRVVELPLLLDSPAVTERALHCGLAELLPPTVQTSRWVRWGHFPWALPDPRGRARWRGSPDAREPLLVVNLAQRGHLRCAEFCRQRWGDGASTLKAVGGTWLDRQHGQRHEGWGARWWSVAQQWDVDAWLALSLLVAERPRWMRWTPLVAGLHPDETHVTREVAWTVGQPWPEVRWPDVPADVTWVLPLPTGLRWEAPEVRGRPTGAAGVSWSVARAGNRSWGVQWSFHPAPPVERSRVALWAVSAVLGVALVALVGLAVALARA